MAFKITATEQKDIGAALEHVGICRTRVEDAVRVFNEELALSRAKLQAQVEALNEWTDVVRGKIEDIHREKDEEFDAKSEKWQDSEKGAATREWIEAIGAAVEEINEIAIDFPEELDAEELLGDDPAEKFAELDKEPQE